MKLVRSARGQIKDESMLHCSYPAARWGVSEMTESRNVIIMYEI